MKRTFIFLILFIMFLWAQAQSAFSELAAYYFLNGDYEEAIRLGEKALEICDITYGRENEEYANCLHILAKCHLLNNDLIEARNFGEELLLLKKKLYGDDSPEYANALIHLASYEGRLENFSKVIILGKEAERILREWELENSRDYGLLLEILANCQFQLGNYEEAQRLEGKALMIYENTIGSNHPDFLRSLKQHILYNANIGKYDEAIKLGQDLIEIRERLFGDNNLDYAKDLHNLAQNLKEIGQYHKALVLECKAIAIVEGNFTESTFLATLLTDVALTYSYIGDSVKAQQSILQAIAIYENNKEQDSFKYAVALHNLGQCKFQLGEYKKALEIEQESSRIIRNLKGIYSKEYASSLNNTSIYLAYLGNYEQAITLGNESLDIIKGIVGIDNPDYATQLNNLATIYVYEGNYLNALQVGQKIIDILERNNRKETLLYPTALLNMANYNSKIGNYTDAIRLSSEALTLIEQNIGKQHLDYAKGLNNLANYNFYNGNITAAINLINESLDIQENTVGTDHPFYAMSLQNLSLYYSELGLLSESEDIILRALALTKSNLGEYHPDYLRMMTNYSFLLLMGGDYEDAVEIGEPIINKYKYYLEETNYEYINALSNLCLSYYFINDYNNLCETSNDITNKSIKNILHYFLHLSLDERNIYWNDKLKYWFEYWTSLFSYIYQTDTFILQNYNGILLSKGILLNSEMEFDKFLAETGDEALLEKYNEIKSLRRQLNKLYEKPIAERYVDTDSLERQANELERQLMQESAEFGDYTRNLGITWENVRDNLREKDATIEFVHFPLSNDSTMYMAYVLRPNMEAPELVKLFEEKDLSSLSDNEIYKGVKGSEMIWAKLYPQLEGAENVYFAPDGVLHQIGIEYLPDYEDPNKLISDRYNLYRLSSTRQIAMKQPAKLSDSAVIYGGIQYDTDPDTMKIESAKYFSTKRGYSSWYNIADSITVRSRQGYLKHTLTEAQALKALFNDNNQHPTLFIGNEASEESFKSLSGKNNNIIHIATHGFYWDEDDAEYEASKNERLLFMSQFGDNARRNVEDKALTRTGLFMAGANNALKGDTLPEDVDDGILTAQEIASLDLRGLDLVVLSACQTGMGDISGDGVFGLQRGFKKAGANTILMSLWDVSDEATQILMTNFYKNYLGGMSKQQALREAQKTVRETPGFSDPEYWAAFILLDALN